MITEKTIRYTRKKGKTRSQHECKVIEDKYHLTRNVQISHMIQK